MRIDRPDVLSQETFGSRDDELPNEVDEIVENNHGVLPARGDIAQDYFKGRVELHFHAAGTIQGDTPIAGNYCLSLRKCECATPLKKNLTRTIWYSGTTANWRKKGDEQASMLVDVVQFFKTPKRMRCRIASVVRLQSLDDCLRTWGKVSYAAQPALLETRAALKDRERSVYRFRIRQRPLEIRDRKRMNQVVERRPEVVETVTDKGENRRWRRSTHLSIDDIIATFRIEFVSDEVRATFSPTAKFYPQFFQMLVRPL